MLSIIFYCRLPLVAGRSLLLLCHGLLGRRWPSGVLSFWWHGVIDYQDYQSVLVDVSVGASDQDEYREISIGDSNGC